MKVKNLLLLAVWLGAQLLAGFSPVQAFPETQRGPQASPLAPLGFSVTIHPDNGIYTGDQVSLVINYDPSLGAMDAARNLSGHPIAVSVDAPNGPDLGSAQFGPGPDPGSFSATLQWVWDTSRTSPGQHSLTFELPDEKLSWVEWIDLLPRSQLPPQQRDSRWAVAQSACCTIHYLTGTDAARDIDKIKEIADTAAQSVARELGTQQKESIQITLLPRVLGQGGFTSSEIEVSYLDRDYAGSTLQIILHHEMVHWFDQRMGGDLRPDLFVEGLATYLTGGHFKPEPFVLETAAVLHSGWYIPLSQLADHFYDSQHELSYLEAASLISYMVDTWGWSAFNAFYWDIHPIRGQGQAAAINAALKSHFGISLDDLDNRFTAFLAGMSYPAVLAEDASLTIRYYETVRAYQKVLDPSAYFRQVWLPNPAEMRKRGITADLLRHPDSPTNLEIEDQLVLVDRNLRQGSYDRAEKALTEARQMLFLARERYGLAFQNDPILVASANPLR